MADGATIFFAGGGTGGHLYPGLAVAEQLHEKLPDAQLVFLCTRREIDKTILQPTGFEFIPQPIVPVVRSVSGLLRFWKGWRETKDQVAQLVRERKPLAVLGLGGYAAGVAVKMAAERGIPTAILNPDVIPGKANQFLMKHTSAVCCQFEKTADFVPIEYRPKLHFTGCPVRKQILNKPQRLAAIQSLKLDSRLNTLVVTGASLGAQTVNEAVITLLESLPFTGWQVLHLAGGDHAKSVSDAYKTLPVPVQVVDFTADMTSVWAVADLCISRSGASSCAELIACGIPSLLMPYPFHKDMHQRANAQVLAEAGAAILIDDEKDRMKNSAKLRAAIQPLLSDSNRRKMMAESTVKLNRSNAASAVANVIRSMINR